MKNKTISFSLFGALLILFTMFSKIQAKTPTVNTFPIKVYQLSINKEIGPSIWRQVKQGFDEAIQSESNIILIHMNTYGGRIIEADSIRTRILNSPIPVYVFINNNAASAGALIALACDSIYMHTGSSIGAATVVNQSGEKMPDKYQSYMRSIMRSTAEAQGKDTLIQAKDTLIRWHRNPKIAEAMVDQRLVIPNLTDSGKVITFTPEEALQNGFCEGIVNSVPNLLKRAGITNYELKQYTPSFIEKIIGFLVSPIVSGLLIMAILGGIYFELQSPGIGFPLGLAIVAAIAYFAPLYLEHLANNWEILLFIIGLILIVLELFVIPGFGIAGISGIVMAIIGLSLSLVRNDGLDFTDVHPDKLLKAFATVITSIFFGFILSIYLSQKMFTAQRGIFKNFALQTVQDPEQGYLATESHNELIGKTGVALTILRPSGKVKIGSQLFDAIADSGIIEQGTLVKVIRTSSAQLIVEIQRD